MRSEKNYVETLKLIVDVYLNPMRKQPSLITPANIKSIFSELQVILNYNALLLKEIEAEVQNWSHASCLGTIFLKMVCVPLSLSLSLSLYVVNFIYLSNVLSTWNQTDFLKAYTQYVNNFPKALTTLNACKQKPAFKAFLAVC